MMTGDIQHADNAIKPDCSLILSLWRAQPNAKYFCIWTAIKNTENEDATDRKHKWFTRDRFGDVQRYVERYVATHNTYATPRGFKHKSRKEGNEADTTLAFADMDASDPRKLPPELRPHIAIESSPGNYVGVWLCDRVVPAEFNQRLTYEIGADKGGWAANKFLRLIPDTTNHKHEAKPRVRLLWDERSIRDPLPVSTLEALPPVRELREASDAPCSSGQSSYTAASGASRDELIDMIPQRFGTLRFNLKRMTLRNEDRSRVTCRHIRELIELGFTDEQIFIMVESCGWNKWADNPEGLRTDIERLRRKGPRS